MTFEVLLRFSRADEKVAAIKMKNQSPALLCFVTIISLQKKMKKEKSSFARSSL